MDSEKLLNQAVNLHRSGKLEGAIDLYKKILKEKTNAYAAANNLALIYNLQQKYLEALTLLENVLKAQPNNLRAITNYGNSLKGLNRYDEAILKYKKVLEIKPNFVDAIGNLANCQVLSGQFDEASNNFQKILEMNPNSVEAHFNYGLLQLKNGNFKEGWKNYEWRKKKTVKKNKYIREQDREYLGGEILKDKTIFIYNEQGLGDYIQFSRYLILIYEMGGKIILDTPESLKSLIETLEIEFEHTDNLQEVKFDYYCSIMSLPFVFNTDLNNIPNKNSYLFANKEKEIFWEKKINNNKLKKIGLAWSGDKIHGRFPNKHIPLFKFKEILGLPYEFYSLQIKYDNGDEKIINERKNFFCQKKEIIGFDNTAALINNLDLVITLDTSIAHLSGALGKETWILLPFVADFRWLINREDSPWYSSVKLFRQTEIDNWDEIIKVVKNKIIEI